MERPSRLIAFLLQASLSAALWLSCGDPSTSSPDPIPPGMVRIAAAGKQTALGSTDSWAKSAEESPRLTAAFTYDFFMDKTEVTQTLFDSLSGRNPATSNFGLGSSYPVYNVTWYDAALFCNARSKSEGLDTVYAYSEIKQDATGRVYDLPGLTLRYERRGYRLPTEAEWEFAARAGVSTSFAWGDAPDSATAVQTAWYTANSGGKTHPVGQLRANPDGLMDMTGNVMEWVDDWKAPYAAVTVKDFLGSREPGLVPERVVKGGSFSYDFRYLRFSSRSANYATLSSAATEYVGFRCALGAISNGQYLSGGRIHSATPVVTPEPSAVQQLFGHKHVKLVFVNATPATRTLCYIDFSETPVTVHEFLDDSTVFTPVISPDGLWVAYANVDEGDAGTGTVKVRRLAAGSTAHALPASSAAIPRWWVNPGSQDTFLVYATHARDNADPAWTSDQTYRVRISGGAASGGSILVSSGGYHDGLSSDGKYLATGYRRLHLRNLTGSDRVLFTGPANGKSSGDTSQVCNVSLHPDFGISPGILLLDFGYATKSSVVGRAYGLHEILFQIDTTGKVAHWYGAPTGFAAWQDVEWSNLGIYAVGTGENQSQEYPAIVGINLSNSSTSVLAHGTSLKQPGLWVQSDVFVPPTNDPGVRDSMGLYNEPPRGNEQVEFAAKMKILWLHRNDAEVIALGSSHLKFGIIPETFTHFKAFNLGYDAGGLQGSGEILRDYLLPHVSHLRAVIFEVHPGWYFLPGGDFVWPVHMEMTRGYQYDRSHDFWRQAVPSFMDSLMKNRTVVTAFTFDEQGGTRATAFGWGTNPPPVSPQGSATLPDTIVSKNLALLETLARSADSQGVLFVMTLFPQSPYYKNTPYYGKYGPTWEAGRALVAQMKQICSGIKSCRFYDANQEGNHDYDSTTFGNEDHIATAGGLILSHRLDSALTLWTSESPP